MPPLLLNSREVVDPSPPSLWWWSCPCPQRPTNRHRHRHPVGERLAFPAAALPWPFITFTSIGAHDVVLLLAPVKFGVTQCDLPFEVTIINPDNFSSVEYHASAAHTAPPKIQSRMALRLGKVPRARLLSDG